MKRDVDLNNEESVKVKETAILELGDLLSQTNKAEGKISHLKYPFSTFVFFNSHYAYRRTFQTFLKPF